MSQIFLLSSNAFTQNAYERNEISHSTEQTGITLKRDMKEEIKITYIIESSKS